MNQKIISADGKVAKNAETYIERIINKIRNGDNPNPNDADELESFNANPAR